jgi:preprotein translocase subunit YajC
VYSAAQQGGGASLTPLLLIVLLFGVMYFLMIRPQQRRRREALQMQSQLGPGDEIVTIGGLHAGVVSVDDDVVTLEIAPGVHARYARPAIARVVTSTAARESDAAADATAEPAADEPIQSPVVETRKSTD